MMVALAILESIKNQFGLAIIVVTRYPDVRMAKKTVATTQ